MQIQSLRIKSYRSWCVADTASEQAIARMKQLELYDTLKSEGLRANLCLQAIGWSKAKYYRWLNRCRQQGWAGLESQSRRPKRSRKPEWTKQQAQAVFHLRKRYPLWGKRKLWKILVRDQDMDLSESTVGRIISKLIAKGRLKPASFYYGQLKPKRQRSFKHHAKRWQYGMKAKEPGELMQIAHMSVAMPAGFSVKEFKAACPVTGIVILKAYSRATSRNAKHFLKWLIAQLPFKLESIQVDGGSEFRDEFEQACEDCGIKLYVLPPRKPKWNGCVERANGSSRYEFYTFYQGSLTVAAINRELSHYQWTYNHYRPHDSLELMTPMAYYQKLTEAA
jgi:putative transposase